MVRAITRYGTHGQSQTSRGAANLTRAKADVNAGKLVLLWSFGDLTDDTPLRDKSNPYPAASDTLAQKFDGIGFPSLHWTLIRKLNVGPIAVKIRDYSWGNAREATFPKNEFLAVYQVHVMADPA